MPSHFFLSPFLVPILSAPQEIPVVRGASNIGVNLIPTVRDRLPTDPVGTFTLTLTNVVVGSTYDVEVVSTGASITNGTAATSSVVLSIPVYAAGSALNSLRIKVRKSSASPYYQPYETQAQAVQGAQSIFINQLSDE